MAGVASNGAATVVSFPMVTTWLAFRLRAENSPLAPDSKFLRCLRVNPAILKLFLENGVPVGVRVIAISLAQLALLSFVNSYSFSFSATVACTAVSQVVAYVQSPAISIAVTASISGTQTIGRGQASKWGDIKKTALLMNLALTSNTGAAELRIFTFIILTS